VKDLAQHYHLLTTDERFQLFADAMARRDDQELDRLENSCPRKHYTMQDYEYTHLKVRFVTYSLASALQRERLEVLALFALVLALSEDTSEENSQRTMGAFRKLMQTRKGMKDGWNRFCEQLGVSPDSITAPFVEHCEWAMEAAEAVCETLDPDEDDTISGKVAQREFEALLAAWE
jgi:hypothetical protein